VTEPASELLIRPAAVSEARELTALVMRSKGYWGYSSEFLAQAASELTVSEEDITQGKVSAAEVEGRSAGVYVLDVDDPPELVALFVEPEFIGKRIGRALLRHALERTRRSGIEDLLIESDPNAEPFYRAHGAVPIGHTTSPTTGRELTLLSLEVSSTAMTADAPPRVSAAS
jgi:GNAT superfamily N-acetyltransferase